MRKMREIAICQIVLNTDLDPLCSRVPDPGGELAGEGVTLDRALDAERWLPRMRRGPPPMAGRRRPPTPRRLEAETGGWRARRHGCGGLVVWPPVADTRCSSRCPRRRLARQWVVCARAAGGAAAAARAFGVASRQAPPAPAPAAITCAAPALLERLAAVVGERAGHSAAAICLSLVHLGLLSCTLAPSPRGSSKFLWRASTVPGAWPRRPVEARASTAS